MKKHIHPVVQLKTDLCQGRQTHRDIVYKYILHLALSGFKAGMDVWKTLASQCANKDQAFAVREENRSCSYMSQDKNYKSY